MTEDREKGVKSLNVALDVLEAVAMAGEDVGVTEISNNLGLTKATVFRHLQTLVDRNYLAQSLKSARYRLGIQSQLLQQLSSRRIDLSSASEDACLWLREKTGLSVVVSAVQPRSVVVLSTLVARGQVQIGVQPGSELSLHSSAQGRVALAFGQPSLLASLKKQKREAYTVHTITDWDALASKIEETRANGWADAPEELALGLNAVAAPVFDDGGKCIGTIAAVSLIQQLPRSVNAEITDAVKDAAAQVSSSLGYIAPTASKFTA